MDVMDVDTGKGSVDSVRSGWMMDRLAEYVSAMDQTCNDRMGWIT
jgi:hypothetical protein